MNFSLLEQIESARDALLVTVLSTEGHSYKKRGDQALYAEGNPHPLYGNLGTTCVDPHIVEAGASARREGKPIRITVDTTDPADVLMGTGTYCGGRVELLIEPVSEAHKQLYRRVREKLENDERVHVVHNMTTGDIDLSAKAPEPDPNVYVEAIRPGPKLCIFGATPLTKQILRLLHETDFSIHVTDWREGYLSTFENEPRVAVHVDDWPIDANSFALVLSHNHERDLGHLRKALSSGCRFIGLLSSTGRRDRMFEQLASEGFSDGQLQRVFSPVGIPIHGRSDPEIGLSIAAQLIMVKNQ